MSTFATLSLVSNIVLGILVLSLIYPKAIQRYKDTKKQRETQANKEREEFIKKVVREYLEELKND
jgi:nucleoside permease NupC